nr:hypothetical protein BaRGS_002827 [Batillaria attramentaria]
MNILEEMDMYNMMRNGETSGAGQPRKPTCFRDNYVDKVPDDAGQVYNADAQCSFTLGEGSYFCRKFNALPFGHPGSPKKKKKKKKRRKNNKNNQKNKNKNRKKNKNGSKPNYSAVTALENFHIDGYVKK